MDVTLATPRSVDERPFLTKSFPWKQEDTVNPRINCRLCSRITTGTLKIQIPELHLIFAKSETLGQGVV